MSLPPIYVGFCKQDVKYYDQLKAWRAEGFEFDLRDCGMQSETRNDDEKYVKEKCKKLITPESAYLLLITENMRTKYFRNLYLRWEIESAISNDCKIIGCSVEGARKYEDETCPPAIKDVGALFISFDPKVIRYAVETYKMRDGGNCSYKDEVYKKIEAS